MKGEQLIMVVGKEALLGTDYFEGFRSYHEVDYESRILGNFDYIKRGLAEEDIKYKQPIGYLIIVNPVLKQVFAYQRSSHDSKYTEKRLQGKWSCGIGGHIDKFDSDNGNPIHKSIYRELEEEVELDGTVKPKLLGYVNYDADSVSKVHFGVLYVLETDSPFVRPKDPEIDNGRLMSIEEFEEICLSQEFTVEAWSKIALEPLKQYLQNLK